MRARSIAVVFMFWAVPAVAQDIVPTDRVVPAIEAEEAARQLLALVNFATLPDISGSQFFIDEPVGIGPENISLIKIPIEEEFPLDESELALVLEGSLGFLSTADNFTTDDLTGNIVRLETDRLGVSGLVGAGLSIPLTPHVRLKPVLSGGASYFDNETTVFGSLGGFGLDPELEILLLDWEITTATVAGSLAVEYDRMFGDRRVELSGRYTQAHTRTVDAPFDVLEFSGNTKTFNFFGRYGGPTGYAISGNPVGWNVFAANTTFVGSRAEALGFQYFFEIGAGIDVTFVAEEPVFEALRFRVAAIVGENMHGYSVGAQFTF